MNCQRLLVCAMILGLIASNAACSSQSTATSSQPIPGIDTPLTVEGIPLQVIGVRKLDAFCMMSILDIMHKQPDKGLCSSDIEYYRPSSYPWDTFLVVGVELKLSDPNGDINGEVSVSDENGFESKRAKSFPNTWEDANSKVVANSRQVYWLFAVERTSQSFTLHLPGNQALRLDRLLSSAANAAPTAASAPSKEKIVLTSRNASAISVPYCKEAKEKGTISGDTYLCVSSDQGETIGMGKDWLLIPPNDRLAVSMLWEDVLMQIGNQPGSWRWRFRPPVSPTDTQWKTGLYDDSYRGEPLLDIRRNSEKCDSDRVKYRVDIIELAYTPGDPRCGTMCENPSTLERFAANFEYHCDGTEPALRGVIRINSTVAP